ncbi:hypothetical protein [Streptomyces sp. NBC_01497]|uniref:hypothetical protein n=1 Tax=Streptomyces sp. NBC_01497 TaxID=2903885 RepID=UPI002E341BF3|nr:hypothetical protein [Streptomyces sp. NBC_01497]
MWSPLGAAAESPRTPPWTTPNGANWQRKPASISPTGQFGTEHACHDISARVPIAIHAGPWNGDPPANSA